MASYREIIYMVLDQIKGHSDDFTFNEYHVKFLLDKYRALFLKQRYGKGKQVIPEENYQTICVKLNPEYGDCNTSDKLKSTEKIPYPMIGNIKVFTEGFNGRDINYTSFNGFEYAGSSKYSGNSIYSTIAPDSYLYLKSNNSQFLNLEKVIIRGIFSSDVDLSKLKCTSEEEDINNDNCDILDNRFPIEESLIPLIITTVVNELTRAEYAVRDDNNNASDDIPDKMMMAMAMAQNRDRRQANRNNNKNINNTEDDN